MLNKILSKNKTWLALSLEEKRKESYRFYWSLNSKLTHEERVKNGRKSYLKSKEGLTDKQFREKMRCVRMKQYGWKWNKKRNECQKLGVAFIDNIK